VRRGIPTSYGGVKFRSRIEARWAVMFDQLGWRWEYEPLDLDGYIPDFVLMFHEPLLVEVKHELTQSALVRYCRKIEMSGWEHEALVLGATPMLGESETWAPTNVFGLLAERSIDGVWAWGEAVPFRCGFCDRPSLLHNVMSWRCRTSGCYEGDGHIGGFDVEILMRWRMAHEATVWRGVA
jgi:hypothetical protein